MHRSFGAQKYALYAFSIFLSAFLLFAIQPIASKHLLPYFGGSSSVWATSLVFFTATLFLGYAYVYLLTALKSRYQMRIHGGIIVLAMFTTMLSLALSGTIYPPLDWLSDNTLTPALRVLIALTLSVGVPYFLLSTTGPLLQYWYGVQLEEKPAVAAHGAQSDSSPTAISTSPYTLYALSNAGSLLALLSYPFVIEPYIALPTEEFAWVILFFLYAILAVIVTVAMRHIPPRAKATSGESGTRMQNVAWISFAALPAFLLVATTTVLTQLISPVPLLWVVPLAIYLLTFILAFSGFGNTRYMPLFVLIAAGCAYVYTPASPAEIVHETITYLTFLFVACLFFHARLYALRPPTSALPFFYLCTSLGGVIGTVAASLIAPVVFNDFFEFPLGLALTVSVAFVLLSTDFYPRIMRDRTIRMIRVVTPFIFLVLLSNIIFGGASIKILSMRNFYGAVQLRFEDDATMLQNGTTLHGLQPTAREWSYVPTTYYTQGSGIGRAMRHARTARAGNIRVGVIGLGTGSLATYCEKGDVFMFYEIDPDIEAIARSYFSYLSRCEGAEVKIGDGRLTLAKEAASSTRYDVFAVDAFTDDAIPAHLLTQEAVRLYMEHVDPKTGILAIHTSNRFLALYPVLLSIARNEGLTAMVVNNDGSEGYMGSGSQWVLLSKNPRVFSDAAFIGVSPWTPPSPLPAPWTDTYTSLFSVLHVSNPFAK